MAYGDYKEKAQQIEIDFGSISTPITSWIIPSVGVASTYIILVYPSPSPADGRIGNDWELDNCLFTAIAGTNSFTINANPTTRIIGKRNVYYQIIYN